MKRALVIGCSERVWRDVEKAESLCSFDTYYLIKLAGTYWDGGRFVWVTLHPEFMPGYRQQRQKLRLHSNYEVVGPLKDETAPQHTKHPVDRRVSYRWPKMNSSGGSGLFGIKVALDDGHDRVVLAGMPMTYEGKHFVRRADWAQCDSFKAGWETGLPFYKDRTRSLSGGWTQQLLKAPTPEWLGVSSSTVADAMSASNSAARG